MTRTQAIPLDVELRRQMVAAILVRAEGLMMGVEKDLAHYLKTHHYPNPERHARRIAAELGECLDQYVSGLKKRAIEYDEHD